MQEDKGCIECRFTWSTQHLRSWRKDRVGPVQQPAEVGWRQGAGVGSGAVPRVRRRAVAGGPDVEAGAEGLQQVVHRLAGLQTGYTRGVQTPASSLLWVRCE